MTEPGDVVAFAKPRAMALLSGRPSWTWSLSYTSTQLRERLRQVHAKILVRAAPDSVLHDYYPAAQDLDGLARDSSWRLAFQNRQFRIYRLPQGGPDP